MRVSGQAMRASPVTPMVRVPWNAPGDIMKALDGGALGIICPMINNREEAVARGGMLDGESGQCPE